MICGGTLKEQSTPAICVKTDDSCNQWLMEPEFLWQLEEEWPQNPSLWSIACEDPEVKADIKVSMASMTKSVHPVTEYFHRVSSWYRS